MKVFAVSGTDDLATVYMAENDDGKLIEFVESLQPPYPRDERWILMVSTLFGCPVKCLMCDAGGHYHGKPTANEMFAQIDYMVQKWYPDNCIPAKKFKIQFARMGEPAFNNAVLDVLEELPNRYFAPGLMPSISTIAPNGTDLFFEKLLEIKNRLYPGGKFQFQFSVHTTDQELRDKMIPVKKWDFARMASYGENFYSPGDRKITLNFALAQGMPLDAKVLLKYFDPSRYYIKITPLNPTSRATKSKLSSVIDPDNVVSGKSIVESLVQSGYEVNVSIGEVEENLIGSNCGQYVLNYLESNTEVPNGYAYPVNNLSGEAVI